MKSIKYLLLFVASLIFLFNQVYSTVECFTNQTTNETICYTDSTYRETNIRGVLNAIESSSFRELQQRSITGVISSSFIEYGMRILYAILPSTYIEAHSNYTTFSENIYIRLTTDTLVIGDNNITYEIKTPTIYGPAAYDLKVVIIANNTTIGSKEYDNYETGKVIQDYIYYYANFTEETLLNITAYYYVIEEVTGQVKYETYDNKLVRVLVPQPPSTGGGGSSGGGGGGYSGGGTVETGTIEITEQQQNLTNVTNYTEENVTLPEVPVQETQQPSRPGIQSVIQQQPALWLIIIAAGFLLLAAITRRKYKG